MKRRHVIASFAGVAWLAALSACTEAKPQFKSIDLTGADYAKDFKLTDANGAVRTLKEFNGKLVVIFFGYTQCPDVCPTTMAELAEAKRIMGKDGEKVQGIFVTVDPERDTPQVLKAYMGNFDPTFVALRPAPEELAGVAKDYKVFYKKVDGKTATSYTMDHSAASYVYDTRGNLRLYTRYGSGAQALASDLQLLLKS
ncbi:SCO family protein [Caenimonas koreensis]|uniref:Redoxin domain-containing protein n=1 Tax=Caenimonas koreensis DSM 17982 TaxID=1121255 RepID=A0A844BA70_9BURK|nr:SCO family protein [Caenimonas koreensis]MRD48367.1 redoxin domain-containing protein [Caenimonas koreensis DSM 17982]